MHFVASLCQFPLIFQPPHDSFVFMSHLCGGIAGIDRDREVDREVPKENGTGKGNVLSFTSCSA